jgi:hypothetical protein
MSAPPTSDDETTRWFDEEFASTIKPAREATPMTLDSYLERLEHKALVASFRRNRQREKTDE